MGLQDGPDGFDTGLNRKASLPKKDDPAMRPVSNKVHADCRGIG
jgi:hypothetical protein